MKLQGAAVLVLASLNVIISTSVRNGSLLASEMGSAPGERVKRRSRRELVCESGQYKSEHSEVCCTKCKAGTHLLADCTHSAETKCQPCSDNEFMDGENHLPACHRCKQCQEGSGEETKTKCNKTHNTECKCRKNFFCLTSENCLKCRRCKECDVTTQEIVQPCTENNDTVCVEKDIQSSNTGVVIGVVIGVVVVIVILVGAILYFKKHHPCNKSGDFQLVPLKPADANKQMQEVPDIELSAEDLSLIVAEIEPKKFHDLGLRLGLGEPKLQQIEADYYNDKSRQGYEILSSWLQGHGRKGAFPLLIATLNKAKCVSAAENILKVIPPAEDEDTTERSRLDTSENGTRKDSVSV